MVKSLIAAVFGAALASCLLVGSAAAQGSFTGTWKINVERSVYNPGPRPPSDQVTYYQFEDLGSGLMRFTLVGSPGAAGNLGMQVSVFRIDGQQHPVYAVANISELITSDRSTSMTRSYRQIDANTVEFITYNDGIATDPVVRQMEPDGNSYVQRPANGEGNVLLLERVR